MAAILPDPRLDVPRKPVAAHLRPSCDAEAKAECKPLAVDWKRRQAEVFVRVLQLGKMTLQELAHKLGYSDQSAVSRWASATERPQWDRIAEIKQLQPWISVAWGEATGADVQVAVIVRGTA